MKTATATLESIAPYSQSRKLPDKIDKKLPHDEWEKMMWKHRLHTNKDGQVFIPPMAFKKSLEEAARYLRLRIPGKDRSEYTKHFKSGVIIPQGPLIDLHESEVEHEWQFVSASGRAGSGTRVNRCFPLIREWKCEVEYYVVDETITKDVFERVLHEAGNFIGIGRFRPENGGFYGRYKVNSVKWS